MGIQKTSYANPRLDLGAGIMEYFIEQDALVGTQALPIFKTPKKEASYAAITRESLTREGDTKRAARAKYQRDDVDTEDKTFKCEEHGLEGALDDSERALFKNDFDAEMATTRGIANKLMIAQEKRIADLVFNTTTFTGSSLFTDNSGSPWATAGTDIIGQVDAGKDKVRANTGMSANGIIMSYANLTRIKGNTDIKDRIKYTSRASESQILNALADLFGLDYVWIAKGIRNSAKHGQAFSGSDIWNSSYVMVGRFVTNGQDLKEPGLGRTFLWDDDSSENVVVEEYRDESARSDIYRVRQHVDEVIVDPQFGHLIQVA